MGKLSLYSSTALSGLSILTGVVSLSALPAHAQPQNGDVKAGSASFSQENQTFNVHQHSDKVIIDWSSFDIGLGEETRFWQPSSSSIALNRILDNKPSEILGRLTANGNIVLINPNGMVLGPILLLM